MNLELFLNLVHRAVLQMTFFLIYLGRSWLCDIRYMGLTPGDMVKSEIPEGKI